MNGVFNLFTPKFFELFPDVCDQAVKYVAVGKVFFRKSLKRSSLAIYRYDISEIVQTYLYLFPHAISAHFFSIKKHFFRAYKMLFSCSAFDHFSAS